MGLRPGSSPEGFALMTDVAPTVLDVAGIRVPAGLDGRSLVPALKGLQANGRRSFLIENYNHPGYHQFIPTYKAMRFDNGLYVRYSTGEKERYDMSVDPYQTNNLVAGATSEVTGNLDAKLDKLSSCSGAACRAEEDVPAVPQ